MNSWLYNMTGQNENDLEHDSVKHRAQSLLNMYLQTLCAQLQ